MRIFAVSDLHIDYQINAQWVDNLSYFDYQDDILILAGDVTDNIQLLEQAFSSLKRKFKQVHYLPGNHDLWIIRSTQQDSIDKFNAVYALAADHGIITQAYEDDKLAIIPLLGWYDFSFGALDKGIQEKWMDFLACKWPESSNIQEITQFFLEKNEPLKEISNKNVITFSHFLPRIDVMPNYIPNRYNKYHAVLGSNLIEKQVRTIKPQFHIYGHSHINQEINLEGICYINNAFGYPTEQFITRKQLFCVLEI